MLVHQTVIHPEMKHQPQGNHRREGEPNGRNHHLVILPTLLRAWHQPLKLPDLEPIVQDEPEHVTSLWTMQARSTQYLSLWGQIVGCYLGVRELAIEEGERVGHVVVDTGGAVGGGDSRVGVDGGDDVLQAGWGGELEVAEVPVVAQIEVLA